MDLKIEGAAAIVFYQLPAWTNRRELMNANSNGLSLNLLSTTRKFIKLAPANLFGGIQWWRLVDFSAQTAHRTFNLIFSPSGCCFRLRQRSTGNVAGFRSVTKANYRVVFFVIGAEKLSETRRAAE